MTNGGKSCGAQRIGDGAESCGAWLSWFSDGGWLYKFIREGSAHRKKK